MQTQRRLLSAAFAAAALVASPLVFGQASPATPMSAAPDGVVKVRSAYPMDETIARIKDDIARKGIMFFAAVDQAQLAANAGIALPPSTLLMFGNPALGSQFITAKGEAGLAWPVRQAIGERDYPQVFTEPHPSVVAALSTATDMLDLCCGGLPSGLEPDDAAEDAR